MKPEEIFTPTDGRDGEVMKRIHTIGMRFLEEPDLSVMLDEIVVTAMAITDAQLCLLERPDRLTGKPYIYIRKESARWADLPQVTERRLSEPFDLRSRSGMSLGVLTLCYDRQMEAAGQNPFMRMLVELASAVLDRISMEEALQRTLKNTEILYEVVGLLLENDPVQNVIERLCNKVMQFLNCDVFFNYLIPREKPGTMQLNACGGVSQEQADAVATLEFGQSVCGMVASLGERMIVEDIQNRGEDFIAILKAMGISAYVCHPLLGHGSVMGTLSFGSRSKNSFDESELELMRTVSSHVASAVDRLNTEDELRLIADEIREKSKLVTEFFTNISHEFKTPLSIILVDLQLMEYRLRNAGGGTPEQFGKMVDIIRQNALRLLRLIGNLLDVTKVDAGYMTVRMAEKDIVALVREIVSSVRDYAHNASVSIRFESEPDRRMMPVDEEKLERILLNLLSNAIKHTREGGHILVAMRHDDAGVTITVDDDGEGIPDEEQEIIFDRFKQVNATLTRASEGSGIGLSLTKALVELMSGRIWFESQYGQGSRFHVWLPALEISDTAPCPVVEGLTLDRKVEMEFSDIGKAVRPRK